MTAIPKPRPRALDKQDRAKAKQSVEERENKKVKARSRGQCEVKELEHHRIPGVAQALGLNRRCVRRASETHHFLGGMGRRGVKESALARNKLHVCGICHDLITRHILQPHWTDVQDRAGSVTFIRLR